MKRFNSAVILLFAGLMLGGCASTGGSQVSPAVCALIGATIGGGGAAAVVDDDEGSAAAGGALIGAALGYLACNHGPSDSDGDGVTDDLDQCPGTPAGTEVDASGCAIVLDSDGDGVNDDQDQCPGTPAGTTVGTDGCALDSDGDGVTDDNDQCPGTPAGVEVEANGCPKVGETLMTLEGVNFDFDSDNLTYESQAKLDEAVATLNANSLVNVQVVGHTDSRGSESYNQGLSERRAAAVASYLTDNGVSGSRLSSAGMGESQPVADNSTEDGRYQNRRVELVVVE